MNAEGDVEVAEKRARAVELRTRGFGFKEIAAQLGVSKSRAHQLYHEALREIPAAEVEEHRRLQTERLEYLWTQVVFGMAKKATPSWILAGEKLLERHAKLFGLDAPTKVQGEVSVKDDPLAELILRLPGIAERYSELVELTAAGLSRAGGPGPPGDGESLPPAAPPEAPVQPAP